VSGEQPVPLIALFFIVVLGSAPFVFASLKQDMVEHKLPMPKNAEPPTRKLSTPSAQDSTKP
jgi:hypothetical protein